MPSAAMKGAILAARRRREKEEELRLKAISYDSRPSWEKFSAKEWALALQGLTPGGSEFLTPEECVNHVRSRQWTPSMVVSLRTENTCLREVLQECVADAEKAVNPAARMYGYAKAKEALAQQFQVIYAGSSGC